MKEFDVRIKLRNNLLVQRREEMGLSAPQVAEKIGISYSRYIAYESFKSYPLKRDRINTEIEWKESALKIAWFFGESPETLWPDVILAVKKNQTRVQLSAVDMEFLVGQHTMELVASPEDTTVSIQRSNRIERVLRTLTPKEEEIIKRRFGINRNEQTLEEVADEYGVGRERIRSIEALALRKLRHSSRSKHLKVFIR